MKRVVCILLLLLAPATAFAGTDQHPSQPTPAWMNGGHHDDQPDPPPPAGASRLRTYACAFIVLSLIGFAVWTKTKKKNLAAKNPSSYVKVTDSVKVGDKAHLVVATFGNRTMVLGVTEQGIRRIADLPAPAEPKSTAEKALELEAAATTVDEKLTFGSRLGALIRDARAPQRKLESDVTGDDEYMTPVSRPLLRVANDTRISESRLSTQSRAVDPIEEQVSGLLAARARRS